MAENFPSLLDFKIKLSDTNFSGELGTLRAPIEDCLLKANNDWQAIYAWLDNKFTHKPNSRQQYLLQAERLLLWALLVKHKPISSLSIEDFKEYFLFLNNPSPIDKWCMPKGRGGVKRWDNEWRPFNGPLSAASKATAINCINTMLNYWRNFGYIKTNVLKMIDLSVYQKPLEAKRFTVVERALSKSEWQAMQQAVKLLPEKTLIHRQDKIRHQFLLTTFLVTALRREEIANLQWNDFGKLRGVWRLQVTGKGNKPALLVLPDAYIAMANQYRALFNYPALNESVDSNENQPVFFGLRRFTALSGNHIHSIIKKIGENASRLINDESSKRRLQQVSPHWIRHTAATVMDDAGVDKEIIKAHLRHESESTTDIYIHKNVKVIKDALECLIE